MITFFSIIIVKEFLFTKSSGLESTICLKNELILCNLVTYFFILYLYQNTYVETNPVKWNKLICHMWNFLKQWKCWSQFCILANHCCSWKILPSITILLGRELLYWEIGVKKKFEEFLHVFLVCIIKNYWQFSFFLSFFLFIFIYLLHFLIVFSIGKPLKWKL